MPFELLYPVWLALIALMVPALIIWSRRQPEVAHSGLGVQKNLRSWSVLPRIPLALFALAWISMCIALSHPVIPNVSEERVVDSRDIAIAVDISGSMDSKMVPPVGPEFRCLGTCPEEVRKIDIARAALYTFVQAREGDRIALMAFNDNNYYHWPLTTDLEVILQKVEVLTSGSGGTNFQGPVGSGNMGPLQASLNHFRDYGQSRTRIVILVTDGEAPITPERMAELTKQFEQMNVRMYVLGVGEDWVQNKPGTQDLRRFVEAVHGTTFIASNDEEVRAAVAKINETEKSAVVLKSNTDYSDWYLPFLIASLVLWVAFIVFNAATRRTS